MIVDYCYENGFIQALFGIGLSYGLTHGCSLDYFRSTKAALLRERLKQIALKLCIEHGGEDKFLRQMVVCFDISAPRYWWTQMDTYKVGTTAQSESTMHTILKRPIEASDFVLDPSVDIEYLLSVLNKYREEKNFKALIQLLPQSYIQRRIWTANYAVLKNIFDKRATHRLKEWHIFINKTRSQISYPEFLPCQTQ